MGINQESQELYYNEVKLSDNKKTLLDYDVKEESIIPCIKL